MTRQAASGQKPLANRTSVPLVSGQNGLLPVGSQISTYGQQIINTVMIKQVQPGELEPYSSSEKKQSGLMSIKQLEPDTTVDDEPQKPTL